MAGVCAYLKGFVGQLGSWKILREFQIYVSVSWEVWLLWEARSPETQGMTEWIQQEMGCIMLKISSCFRIPSQ